MIIEKRAMKLFAEEAERDFDFVTKQKSARLFTPLILYNLLYIGIKNI